MKTLAIILAQGQQTRLPDLPLSKTMLPLFVRDSDGLDLYQFAAVQPCDLEPRMLAKPRANLTPRVTLLERTIAQLGHMWSVQELRHVAVRVIASDASMSTMVPNEWLTGCEAGRRFIQTGNFSAGPLKWARWGSTMPGSGVAGLSFRSPRNSSLRGIADAMCALAAEGDIPLDRSGIDLQILVLFGDTIYSWDCLRELVRRGREGHGFVISSDLTRSTGEVWGLSWCMADDTLMCNALAGALRKHPPVDDTYQAGQMRRWLFELGDDDAGSPYIGGAHATSIADTDYTRDIDVPPHLKLLPELAAKALADDERNGLRYGHPASH